ncbi:hypothetical protein [Winogradskyella sp.]|uniref:hypothetical protein n=1 Tax=Winogradskyella sp. TaxID=1883156 RepID=UPI002618290B|nr:hypothetical protein [Winogradskyella sp.]
MKLLKILGHIFIIVVLTVLTQIGGLIWVIALVISYWLKCKKRYTFPITYLAFNLILIPLIAPCFGRVQLPVFDSAIKPQSYFYALAFRNYVTPELKYNLKDASTDLMYLDIQINYLDANFPFFDGFPLLPHLSHNDGKKVDIAFQYKTADGKPTNKKPSLLGYGNYVNLENPTNNYCKSKGFWQYDITKYLNLNINSDLAFDKENTKTLIQGLLYRTQNEKLFIEPHLKEELGLKSYSEIRFHGCQAVRHDDHIHLQIK